MGIQGWELYFACLGGKSDLNSYCLFNYQNSGK
jgi:hypothetical protein